MIIAIDGPAGSGKSSTAKGVATALGIVHLDTGAMYRAVTLKALGKGISASDTTALDALMRHSDIRFSGAPPEVRVWMDGEDVSAAIRGDEVTKNVSDYCQPVVVRQALVEQQRRIGASGDCVCEGRDIGTVVFPTAELKFYMTASVAERVRRRQKDFERLGVKKSLPELEAEILERDSKDSNRANSPLAKAADAEEIDTTRLSLDQQIRLIVDKAKPLLQRSTAPRAA
jgi:cytidylate kinase